MNQISPPFRPVQILFLKAFKHKAGYALWGNPPRWHKVGGDAPVPADAHHVAVSHYHAAAVKKLKNTTRFHALSPADQVSKVKALAAGMQAAASASAAVSGWKKAAMSGKNPTPAQWKAYHNLPSGKKNAILDQVTAAVGSLSHLVPPHMKQIQAEAKQADNAEAAPPKPAAATPEVEPDPNHSSVQDPDGKPLTAKQKIVVGGIEKYLGIDLSGTASYIKPSVVTLDISALNQQQIHAIENYGNQFGHFKVTPGGYKKLSLVMPKKPTGNGGAKPAADAEPAAAATPAPDPAPEPVKPTSPNPWTDDQWAQLELATTNSNHKSHNNKIAQMKAAADAGDVEAIQAMKFGSNTYGKKQAKIAEHLIAALNGGAAPAPAAAPKKPDALAASPTLLAASKTLAEIGKQKAEKKQAAIDAVHALGYGVQDTANKGLLFSEHKGSMAHAFPTIDLANMFASQLQKKGIDAVAIGTEKPFFVSIKGALPAAGAAGAPATAPEPAPESETVNVPASVFHNTEGKHNKFWSVSVNGNVLKTTYGKIGTKGQTTEKVFGDQSLANEAKKKLIIEKIGKGYIFHDKTTHSYSVPVDDAKAADPAPPAADDGPKEGDTKQGADGLLVLKNGRWQKMSDGNDSLIDGWVSAIAAGQVPTKAQAMAVESLPEDEKMDLFFENYAQHLGDVDIDNDPPDVVDAAHQAAQDKVHTLHDSGLIGVKQNPIAARMADAIDHWTHSGGQLGSNNGGVYTDDTGQKWYCKFPDNPDHVKSELLAATLYEAAGVAVPHTRPVTLGGKFGIASKWQDDLSSVSSAKLAKAKGAHAGFAIDAWLGNYDVVGLANDNLQVAADGSVVRVDVGGSLQYRAQGKKKDFGNEVTEIDTLRDSSINAKAAAVFGKITKADIVASVAKVAAISDYEIKTLVNEHGPGTSADKEKLAETLIARKNDLLKRYPEAGKVKKKRRDPTKLPVQASKLPPAHDFMNWNGTGKGLSSKAHVNQANIDVEMQMLEVAKKGHLPNLKDFKFQPLDKETGAPVGDPVPIEQHPSKHVVQFHADLVQILSEIANPPQPLKHFHSSDIASVEAIAEAFPPKPMGTSVDKVASNEKLGFWVALGSVSSVDNLRPKVLSDFTSSAIEAAYKKYKQGTTLAKHFINSVQNSGAYNELFRAGKTHDHKGHKLADVAKAALGHATSQPAGTTVYRWQAMTDSMVSKILAAPDGSVIQATGPMCTSYSPSGTSVFGKHRVKIIYAEGAKAVDSFGSGRFESEKEITTLPNSRFVILSKKMVPDVEHGNSGGERMELELLMLPPDLGLPK